MDDEKDIIRQAFTNHDGIIEDKDCTAIHKLMGQDCTVFQVTGFVTYLHKQVAMGRIILNNYSNYEASLKKKRSLWTTYNSPKYRAMRKSGSGVAHPQFAAGFPGS